MSQTSQYAEQVNRLSATLAKCPSVAKLGEDEAPTLAIALSDIEESMQTFLNEQWPRLNNPTLSGEELEDVLFNILEEFRHIAYHFHDPKFFRAIEPTHNWLHVDNYDA